MPAMMPSASSVMSGHTIAAIPVATQMTPSTTNNHQFFAIAGTSDIVDRLVGFPPMLGAHGMKLPPPVWVTLPHPFAGRLVEGAASGGCSAASTASRTNADPAYARG